MDASCIISTCQWKFSLSTVLISKNSICTDSFGMPYDNQFYDSLTRMSKCEFRIVTKKLVIWLSGKLLKYTRYYSKYSLHSALNAFLGAKLLKCDAIPITKLALTLIFRRWQPTQFYTVFIIAFCCGCIPNSRIACNARIAEL